MFRFYVRYHYRSFQENSFDFSIEPVFLTKEAERMILKEKGGRAVKKAKQNSKTTSVYEFRYRSQGHLVMGYLIVPKKLRGRLPCIIFNRGGNADFGMITKSMLFLRLASLSRWGYLCIASQYSGSPGSEGKDEFGGSELQDVLTLYQILKQFPRADVGRIGVYGGSRGGIMTYQMLAKVRWIKAAAVVSGVADLLRNSKLRPKMEGVSHERFGATKKGKKDRSAVYWTGRFSKKTPLLLLHGTADWRVSPLDSIDLAKKLYERKIPFRCVLFEGADHYLSEYRHEADEIIRQWFDRFVKNKESLPNMRPHGR